MSTTTTERPAPSRPPVRRPWYVAVAAVTVAAAAVAGAFIFTGGTSEPDPVAGPPLELSLGANDSLASCMMFEVSTLAGMPVAFEGTATAVEGDQITLTVDTWYLGGDAAEVKLTGTAGMEALIDGVTFEVGKSYLITATDGTVNYCGYSGAATPDLRAAFEEAFAG